MYETFTRQPASVQERAVFNIWKKDKSDTGINLAFGFRVENLDIGRLENAVKKIVSRHESLRSVFFEQDGCVFRKVFAELCVNIERLESDDLRKFIRPFDLEKGPLFRLALYKNIVCLDFCHIITDGFSMAIFFAELNAFYSGKELSYLPPSLSPENHFEIQANTDFWASQFKNPFQRLSIPSDKKAPATSFSAYGGDGSSLVHGVGRLLTKKVRAACRELSVTPFILYFSAFILLLSRECSSKDVVTSTNFSCRNSRNLRSFGLFATTPPVRFFVDEDLSSLNFIKKVNSYVRECLNHQSFDSEKLLEICGLADLRDFSRTIFTFEHEKMADIRLDGKKCDYVPIPSKHSACDLTFCLFPFKEESQILAIFRADLFSSMRIRRLTRHYVEIIRKLLDKDRKLFEI